MSNEKVQVMNVPALAQLWAQLTQPHNGIIGIEQRRHSRLLAAMMLTIAFLSLLASLLVLLQGLNGTTVITIWVGVALTITLYFLNRSGHYQLSAYLFVGLNFLLVHAAAPLTQDPFWLLFGAMVLFLAIIFLPIPAVITLFVLSFIIQLEYGTIFSLSGTLTVLGTTTVLMLTGILIFVFVLHRAGIELERQAELEAANQKLRESEAALEQRVEQRTRELILAKEEAEAARQHAERADYIKSQFLANMSHELRTPLNAILNFTEFVNLEMFGPINEKQRDALSKSLESGRHLHSLINDVLDITKIESGMMKLFVEPDINIMQMLPAVVVTAQTLLAKRDVQLITDIDHDLPLIEGDNRRIRQVLLNLLSNACKFTQQGTITLGVKDRCDHVLFCVSDTGVGIEPADQQMIFQPFRQTEHGLQHREGTGLGLPISQWMVKAHGGSMWLESAPGEGSTFYFTIPVKPNTELISVVA